MKLYNLDGLSVKENSKAVIIKHELKDIGREPGYYYLWSEDGENSIVGPYPTFEEAKEAYYECSDDSISNWLAKNPASITKE